jgi:hypothetical protein
MTKYRAKPVEVDAVEWTGTSESWAEVCALVGDAEDVIHRNADDTLAIQVGRQSMRVRVGSWILKSGEGLAMFEDKVFSENYEPVLEMGKEGMETTNAD